MQPARKSASEPETNAGNAVSSPPPEFVHAPQGGAAGVVKAAVAEAGEGRQVVVYVGAEWCEPCQYFHKAVEAGELDAELAGVRFVEFDSDDDGERLTADGYDGKLIPRFVVPAGDGAASDRRIEGGIKGDGAVEHIMRRLAPMLASG